MADSLVKAPYAGPDYAPLPAIYPGTTQTLTVTATAAATASAIGSSAVYIYSTVPCHVAFGTAPTATASDMVIPAGGFTLACNADDLVSLLKLSGESDGNAWVTSAAEV